MNNELFEEKKMNNELLVEFGGGHRPRPNYQQFESDLGSNIITDELPYEDNSIDVVYMSHIIEHIPFYCTPGVLTKIHKKLKPGGYLRVLCPDLEQIINAYVRRDYDAFLRSNNHWGSIHPLNRTLGIGGFFLNQIISQPAGDPDNGDVDIYVGDKKVSSQAHISAFDFEMMFNLLKNVGFSSVIRTEITSFDTHQGSGQLSVNAWK